MGVRNHAKEIGACDFLVAVTATFRQVYIFVVIEHQSRKLLHFNVTSHPNADVVLESWPNLDNRNGIPSLRNSQSRLYGR